MRPPILLLILGALAQKLSGSWKQQVLVDNRPGGGTIGSDIIAKSASRHQGGGHEVLLKILN